MTDLKKNLILGVGSAVLAIALNMTVAKAGEYEEIYSGYYETCKGNDCFEAEQGELCPVNKDLLIDGSTLDTADQIVYMECWELTGEIDYATDITLNGGL